MLFSSGSRQLRLVSGARLFASKKSSASSSLPLPGPLAALNAPKTHQLEFVPELPTLPRFQVLNEQGKFATEESQKYVMPKEECLKIYKQMITLNIMDVILFDAQRQGRISFYMTNYGEEATHFGPAAALELDDIVFGQYREAGVMMHRGFTLDEFMNQCYSNELDYGKGRQMPVHYGSKKLNFHTISSPLGTQIPQAAGAAYSLRREGKKNVAVVYFGEGAASEGDFHYGLNFAATIGCPTLFICRNNGYAISTPSTEQYRGDGIASRGSGYGVKTLRVDGNDVFAMYHATKFARDYAIENNQPVLIEAMTYRIGHHSTSDDSSAYRSKSEADDFGKRDNPINRLKSYIVDQGWWTEEEDKVHRKDTRKSILEAFNRAEAMKKPAIEHLFTDVLDTPSKLLQEQEREMHDMIKDFPDQYPTDLHAK